MKRIFALLMALAMLALCACDKTPAPEEPLPPLPPAADEPTAPEAPEAPVTPEGPAPTPGAVELALPDPLGAGWNQPCLSAMGTGPAAEGPAPGILTSVTPPYEGGASIEEREADGCTVFVPELTLSGFRNLLLQETVSDDLQALFADLRARRPAVDLSARMAELNAEAGTAEYYLNWNLSAMGDLLCLQASAFLNVTYGDAAGQWITSDYRQLYTDVLYYDLRDGHKMTLAELFAPDCDYMALLNRLTRAALTDFTLTRPFAGLPEGYPMLLLTGYGAPLEMTAQCPYFNALSETYWMESGGTTPVLPLAELYPHMPILWGDCAAHFEDETPVERIAPERYDLRMGGQEYVLPSNEEYTNTVSLPRIASGVPEEVRDAVNGALAGMEEQATTQARTWFEEYMQTLPPEGTCWSWIDPSFDVVGSYLQVNYSLSVSTAAANRWESYCAVFDLRTGGRVTLRELLADEEAAFLYLMENSELTPEEGRAALAGSNFILNYSLNLWGALPAADGVSKDWTLPSSFVNADLF